MQIIIVIVVFIIAMVLVKKYNDSVIGAQVQKAEAVDPMPKVAEELGLTFERQKSSGPEGKSIMEMGSRIYGTYQDLPIEMRFYMKADHENVPLGYQTAYSYTLERTVTFIVKNPDNKAFHILPKDKNVVAKPTGNSAFDSCLILTGDMIVPGGVLDYFGKLGWMNLKLKGTSLVFNDTYMEQFTGVTAGMKMLTAVHPIWKSSAKNQNIDISSVRKFLDELVELAREAGMT